MIVSVTIEELANANCDQMSALCRLTDNGITVRVFGDNGGIDHYYSGTLIQQWDRQPS